MIPQVVSAFPGVGKTTVFKNREQYTVNILDSDSSTFDKSEFPQNYLAHILTETRKGNLVLASSHDVVREGLVKVGLKAHLVYPHRECKMEYLQRYVDRGSPQPFVDLMYNKWDEFIDGCEKQQGFASKTILLPSQYLSDDMVISSLLKGNLNG